MSRVVVAGPYPTMPGPESAATFALVRSLVAAGDDVTVVSPQPSAAHHHAALLQQEVEHGVDRIGAAQRDSLFRFVDVSGEN